MEIRQAQAWELDAIMEIYGQARLFMRRSGNQNQWVNGYPSRELIAQDIAAGHCYAVWHGEALAGVFCYLQGKDAEPAYAEIDGAWLDSQPYGVIHRIASSGRGRGLMETCRDWALAQCPSLRIDTHRDNRPMRQSLERCGFQYCGTVVIGDGTERLAYQITAAPPQGDTVDFEKLVNYRNTKNRFSTRLGIVVESITAKGASVTKRITADDLNPLGRAHGGVYFTMADSAAGSAMVAKGYAAVTVSASYNFFRSVVEGDVVTAEASEVKSGKTICVYDVRVTDQNGNLLGTGTFTFYQLEEKIEF